MPVIDYNPSAHQVVDMVVSTAITDGEVSSLEVKLRAKEVIADPLAFITTNSLGQEILSKAGLDEETPLLSGVLASSSTSGPDYIYILTYETVESSS